MEPTSVERAFLTRWRQMGGPEPEETEWRFDPTRRWRFDFAWPSVRVAVEVEGGTWVSGRHSRGAGYAKDCEKYNAAAAAGWVVFRFTAEMIEDPDLMDVARQHVSARLGWREARAAGT